ncbi:MAG: ATP-binding protein [Planctomycetota bacterium]
MPSQIPTVGQGRFFRRIFTRVGILIAVAMAVIGVVTWEISDQWLRDYTDVQMGHLARMAEIVVRRGWPYADTAALSVQCRLIERDSGMRVTVIDPSGRVLGESEGDIATMENHGSRPEVLEALNGTVGHHRRRSTSVGKQFVYVAVPMMVDGKIVAIVRIAAPAADFYEREVKLGKWLASGLAVALPLALFSAWIISRTLARPVQRVGNWARQLATGDLDTRVEVDDDDEVGQVAESLERMRVILAERLWLVQQQRQDLEVTLGNLEEGVIAVNEQGVVLMANAAARTMLAIDSTLIGWPLTVGLKQAALSGLWSEAVRTNRTELQRVIVIDEPAPRLTLNVVITRVKEPDTPIAWLLCVRDISDLARSTAMKADFVANASHELRTPVAAIRGAAETLRSDGLDDANRIRFMDMIDRNIERLSSLTEDLMHLNRVESVSPDLKTTTFDLDAVFEALRLSFGEQVMSKNATLSFTGGDFNITTDARWLELILKNLIDNALKFIDPGGHVRVSCERADHRIVFKVADDGCGIPPEDLHRVFERFYQVDKSRSMNAGGTGLGLAIVKHAVLGLGGEISIESGVAHGTTVTFWTPANPLDP